MVRRRIRARLSYANVVATLALFGLIAGGTAIALPGKHRVTADDLHRNAVRARAVAPGAAGASEIKDGTVVGDDIANGAVNGGKVADGSIGYQDLGSNSVVARIRSSGPVNTANADAGSPINVPLSGNTWTQAANETDVVFGQLSYTQPSSCTGSPFMDVILLVDGVEADGRGYNTTPGTSKVDFFAVQRAYAFEPGAATPHTATVQVYDECTGPGESFVLHDVEVDVIGMR
jgi:hypothetical protein